MTFATASTTDNDVQEHITIPLVQHQPEKNDAFEQTIHAVSRHAARGSKYAVAPEHQIDAGFWLGTFDVGASKNVDLLIDTGSADVAINPDLYQPSPHAQNLHQKGELQYITTNSDGCGVADIKYQTFTDTVCMAGLTSHNQTLAKLIKTKPPNAGTITVFRHGGLVGFGGTKASQTQIGGKPFFQQLCDQGAVKACRFGLAYGTEGRGKQILGGVDKSLFKGDLSFSPINPIFSPVEADGNVVYSNENGSGKIKNQYFIFDSGTANIVGPRVEVRKMFKALGIQIVKQTAEGCASVIYGYYACDSPAKVGFTLGGKPFYIEPSAFQLANNGENNCTATITSLDGDAPYWIVGQSWFQGKYVDFQQPHKIGAAYLKDKTMAN
ncbi:uncharacterized protein LTR77_003873 [Saxophila tyrrhenica]|uniref:Peptidase A1 domain-containing protein n=1 Tax=Saxophila tyrrhenica TaxID=1690608 RepID=A0AAV9PFD7_9PEZI|nr:hypothetical protein LTR77_003873 [Saxophila tyrrhenica]